MEMKLNYPEILEMFPEHLDSMRSESASFLIWYLENYYRLDASDAEDCICDQSGDKGIDGIFVDHHLQTITLFQAWISQKNTTVGDVGLKEFAGSLMQFSDTAGINDLITSAGGAQVAGLLKRMNIADIIDDYDLRGEFISNVDLDANGSDFLQHTENISFVGRTVLTSTFISDERDAPISNPVTFDVSSFQVTEYAVDEFSKAYIAQILASDLVKLDGIANQSIFNHNVRGPLGSTNVNKDIGESIRLPALHKQFPLFHNGITVIAGNIDVSNGGLTVSDYFVVNGCQSLVSLYKNQIFITDDLHLLTKFIRVDPNSLLAQQITEYSNNQNGVRARDFKANSAPQVRLQNEFKLL